jgi:hypothetical protein
MRLDSSVVVAQARSFAAATPQLWTAAVQKASNMQ